MAFVGHIGQEVALGLVGGLSGLQRLHQNLVHLPLLGAVGEHKNKLLLLFQHTAAQKLLKPAQLLGLDLKNLPLVAPKAALRNGGQGLRGDGSYGGGLIRVPKEQGADILLYFLCRKAQDPLQVGADILRLKGLWGEEDKDILCFSPAPGGGSAG